MAKAVQLKKGPIYIEQFVSECLVIIRISVSLVWNYIGTFLVY